jgi:hypothetical protein
MPNSRRILAVFALALLLAAGAVFAASVKTYQVTGPVLEVNSDMIVVQKGKDRWEIARDASTKIPPDVKVGDKVTIEYRMHATSVEVKAGKATSAKKTKKAA